MFKNKLMITSMNVSVLRKLQYASIKENKWIIQLSNTDTKQNKEGTTYWHIDNLKINKTF